MRLFSFRMRAISTFIFDDGMSTRRCFDPQALRIRVSMSAIGSVMDMVKSGNRESGIGNRWSAAADRSPLLLPAGLSHAGDHPGQREVAKAETAEAEPAQERARPPT